MNRTIQLRDAANSASVTWSSSNLFKSFGGAEPDLSLEPFPVPEPCFPGGTLGEGFRVTKRGPLLIRDDG